MGYKRPQMREEVFRLLDGERAYQLRRHELVNAKHPHRDRDHHVADWIIYMEAQLQDAKKGVYNFDMNKALSHIRKATALGVACMEYNKTPARNPRQKPLLEN